ncbi:MAG: hypothetical protein J6Y20_03350 [Lachnospiraceae bacterium]|nr:hypothetical protein [Lachnospiraceae bacterium]MBR4813427.1 hypothetical protein [Lachnospiraceae bacterium]MBR7021688.1 hypothetical protein [Lachnospiraceae bacterium]
MGNSGSYGEWTRAKEELVSTLMSLGHPGELGELIARQLGSPKAIRRMTSYLHQVRPRSAEEVVDEMLAISSEIEAWHKKKASEQANASYTEYLNERRAEDDPDD